MTPVVPFDASHTTAGQTNVSLTVDERDAIDAAKQRAKDMLTLVITTLNQGDVLTDCTGAVLTACDIIREALNSIDETFAAADERQEAASAGGAR